MALMTTASTLMSLPATAMAATILPAAEVLAHWSLKPAMVAPRHTAFIEQECLAKKQDSNRMLVIVVRQWMPFLHCCYVLRSHRLERPTPSLRRWSECCRVDSIHQLRNRHMSIDRGPILHPLKYGVGVEGAADRNKSTIDRTRETTSGERW